MHFIKQQANNIDCFENGWNLWLFPFAILRNSHQNASSPVSQKHFTDFQSSTEKTPSQNDENTTINLQHGKKQYDVFGHSFLTSSSKDKAPGAS